MSRDGKRDRDALTIGQHLTTAAETMFAVVPLVGPLVDKGVFGTLNKRRQNRVTATLAEIAERLDRLEKSARIDSEPFLALFEELVPYIAKATHETKRRFLRDLLLHGAIGSQDDATWSEAELAAKIVIELDAPALALLAAAGVLGSESVFVQGDDDAAVAFPSVHAQHAPMPGRDPTTLPFSLEVLSEWARRMKGLALVQLTASAPGKNFAFTPLPLARLVIRWAVWSD